MQFPAPPRGLKAIPWRLPILLYQAGLGWTLGGRFLRLQHQGRKSGKTRSAVLEIIHSQPDHGLYYVASGFGTASDWYRNIRQHSRVNIQIGGNLFPAEAKQLDPEHAAELIIGYAQRNPSSLKTLIKMLGYEIDFSREGLRAFGQNLPVIQFQITDMNSQEETLSPAPKP